MPKSRPYFGAARLIVLWACLVSACQAQPRKLIAAENLGDYLPLLQGKRVGLVVNHTSTVGSRHLADTLMSRGVRVRSIFAPEHGFRGEADAGALIADGRDPLTGLRVISLYGKNKKPQAAQVDSLDILVFDIQDVGVRFYTYISTLQYMMEACAERRKPLLLLDRPNPLAGYVAGPVLDTALRSFVGMQPVPIVYGMTLGEYARMLNGEGWLAGAKTCSLTVIPLGDGYTHRRPYVLPKKPSPNLPTGQSIALYPSLCLFEGTPLSVGRGTPYPFEWYGGPHTGLGPDTLTPHTRPGAAQPPLKGVLCYGRLLRQAEAPANGFTLRYLLEAYQAWPDKSTFFIPFFDKLAGTRTLRQQIEQGMDETAITATWQKDLAAFSQIRKKYLLYKE